MVDLAIWARNMFRMNSFIKARKPRRQTVRLYPIDSPLSRVAYAIPKNAAHLLSLEFGVIHLRQNSGTEIQEHRGPGIFWLPEGVDRELLALGGARGLLVSIPKVVLAQTMPSTPLGEQMRRALSEELNLTQAPSDAITSLLAGIAREHSDAESGADFATGLYLTLVLLQLCRMAHPDLSSSGALQKTLPDRFISLAGQRIHEHWKIEDFSRELEVSRDQLGVAVKRATGLSPQEYLHRLLVQEANELLTQTDLPVSQVAFRLGFLDPAYFTRFFKRETGQNPGAYRKGMRSKLSEDTMPFSSWP